MKKILKICLVFLSLSVITIIGFCLYAPHFLESKIENKITEFGWKVDVHIKELSFTEAVLDLKLQSPYEAPISSLKVTWDLKDYPNNLPFSIITITKLSLLNEIFDLDLLNLFLRGNYSNSTLKIESASSEIDLKLPFKGKLNLQSRSMDMNKFNFDLALRKQKIRNEKYLPQTIEIEDKISSSGLLEITPQKYIINWSTSSPVLLKTQWLGSPLKATFKTFETSGSLSRIDDFFSIDAYKAKASFQYENTLFKLLSTGKNISPKNNGTLSFDIKSMLNPNSLLAPLKHFNIDWLNSPKGIISIKGKSTFTPQGSATSFSIDSDFSNIVLFAVPSSQLKLRSTVICDYNSELDCRLKNGGHSLSVKRMGEKSPFNNLNIKVNTIGRKISGNASLEWLGGEIKSTELSGTTTKPLSIQSKYKISKLNLEQLSKILDMSNLSASGKMNGGISLDYSGTKGLVLLPSTLESEGKGVLHYKDPASQDIPKKIETLKEFNGLMKKGQQALVYKALDNFHYQKMKVDAERPGKGLLALKLHLYGANPDLANGQIFDITIPIDGNLEGLLAERSFQTLAESESSEEYIKRLRKALR